MKLRVFVQFIITNPLQLYFLSRDFHQVSRFSCFCLILFYYFGAIGNRHTTDQLLMIKRKCMLLNALWLPLWMTLGICLNPEYYKQLLILLGPREQDSRNKSNAFICLHWFLIRNSSQPPPKQIFPSWVGKAYTTPVFLLYPTIILTTLLTPAGCPTI